MFTVSELLVIQQLANFADAKGINKSKVSRDTEVSRMQVHNIINKFKELNIHAKG